VAVRNSGAEDGESGDTGEEYSSSHRLPPQAKISFSSRKSMGNPLLLALLLSISVVVGQFTNITVDDGSLSITYFTIPGVIWEVVDQTALDFPFTPSSSHRLAVTNSSSVYATFDFTGTPLVSSPPSALL